MTAICIVKFNSGFYALALQPEGGRIAVQGWPTQVEAVKYWENAYLVAHRTPEKSAAACLHYMAFDPIVVVVNSVSDLKPALPKAPAFYELGNVSGRVYGVKLKTAAARKLIETGVRPRLAIKIAWSG